MAASRCICAFCPHRRNRLCVSVGKTVFLWGIFGTRKSYNRDFSFLQISILRILGWSRDGHCRLAFKAAVDVVGEKVDELVHGHQRSVDSEIVAGGGAPGAVGVEVIVIGSQTVDFGGMRPGLVGRIEVATAHYPAHTLFDRGMYKYAYKVRMVAKHVVGRASHYHTRGLAAERTYEVALSLVDLLVANRRTPGIQVERTVSECEREKSAQK